MATSQTLPALTALLFLSACTRQEEPLPAERRPPAPLVVVKQQYDRLSEQQRIQLGFPESILRTVRDAAGAADAEPFFELVESRSENLRGENEIAYKRLAGFSVRTTAADDLISAHAGDLRRRGYLLFRSRQNYGSVPDVVTVIRGGSSYDILRVQKTEAPGYSLSTTAIIRWLKAQQQECSFVIIGAGQDFVEGRFVRQPADMAAFARKVIAFAPDVLHEGPRSAEGLAEQMKRTNGFRLVWD